MSWNSSCASAVANRTAPNAILDSRAAVRVTLALTASHRAFSSPWTSRASVPACSLKWLRKAADFFFFLVGEDVELDSDLCVVVVVVVVIVVVVVVVSLVTKDLLSLLFGMIVLTALDEVDLDLSFRFRLFF